MFPGLDCLQLSHILFCSAVHSTTLWTCLLTTYLINVSNLSAIIEFRRCDFPLCSCLPAASPCGQLQMLSIPLNWPASLSAVSMLSAISNTLAKVRSFSESSLLWQASFSYPTAILTFGSALLQLTYVLHHQLVCFLITQVTAESQLPTVALAQNC